jgi:hypothetical protein
MLLANRVTLPDTCGYGWYHRKAVADLPIMVSQLFLLSSMIYLPFASIFTQTAT